MEGFVIIHMLSDIKCQITCPLTFNEDPLLDLSLVLPYTVFWA